MEPGVFTLTLAEEDPANEQPDRQVVRWGPSVAKKADIETFISSYGRQMKKKMIRSAEIPSYLCSKGLEVAGGLLNPQGNDVVMIAEKTRAGSSGDERGASGGER